MKDQKRNCLRFRPNESWNHVLKKTEICFWLQRNGYEFYTEAEFKTGGRCDIVVYSPEEFIVEVAETETQASKDNKNKTYPAEIRWVNAGTPFNEKDIQ